jgi:hypothetical protein
MFTPGPWSLGSVIALVILVLVIVFVAIGHLPMLLGCLIGGLALARLF